MSRISFRHVPNCHVMDDETHDVRSDFQEHAAQVAMNSAAFADQINEIDIVAIIDIGPYACDAQIWHVEGRFVHNQRRHIRHGDQNNLHHTSSYCHDSQMISVYHILREKTTMKMKHDKSTKTGRRP